MEEEKQDQPEVQETPPTAYTAPTASALSPAKADYRIGDWIAKAWQLATAQIWPMVLLGLLGTIPGTLLTYAVTFPVGFAVGMSVENQIAAQLIAGLLGGIIGWIISATLIAPLMVGILAVLLNYNRTQQINYSLLGTGFGKWTDSFMIGIWPGLLIFIPSAIPCLAVLILPLFFAALLWYNYALISLSEPGMTHSQSADRGYALIKSNFWYGVLLMLTGAGIGLAGAIACCVGTFFAAPLFWLVVAIAYDDLAYVPSAVQPAV